MTDAQETPRYSWTQPQCLDDYERENPDRPATRLRFPEDEICVTCGQPTRSGIYIRIDPAEAAYPTMEKT